MAFASVHPSIHSGLYFSNLTLTLLQDRFLRKCSIFLLFKLNFIVGVLRKCSTFPQMICHLFFKILLNFKSRQQFQFQYHNRFRLIQFLQVCNKYTDMKEYIQISIFNFAMIKNQTVCNGCKATTILNTDAEFLSWKFPMFTQFFVFEL